MKQRRVAPLGQFNPYFFMAAFFLVITSQSGTQPAGLHSNDRVRSWIERCFAIENFDTDRVFLEVFTATCDSLFNNITEKTLEPVNLRKCGAG